MHLGRRPLSPVFKSDGTSKYARRKWRIPIATFVSFPGAPTAVSSARVFLRMNVHTEAKAASTAVNETAITKETRSIFSISSMQLKLTMTALSFECRQ